MTLQRKLSDAGEAHVELAQRAREQTARRRVTQTALSLAEVALLLDFSDQSSFTRAFKRWTGTTPAAFRASGSASSRPQ